MRLFFTFTILCLLLSQCVESEKGKMVNNLIEPEQILNVFDFSNLSQYTLTCTDSELIATDARSNKIFIFDYETLEIVEVFGRKGRGPGEFNGAYFSTADDKNLYVYDSGNQRISVFNKDDFSHQSTIPMVRNASRFAVSSNYIYLSSPFTNKESPFMKISINGKVDYFGEWLGFDFFGRNMFHILIHDEKIIAVSHTEPIIQIYNKEGELLDKHNLTDEKYITETLEYTAQFYQHNDNNNRTVALFNDASFYEDYLVLNFYTRPDGGFKTNNYLVYKIEENNLERVAFFETNIGEDGITRTFCIHKNMLYSNGGQGGLNLYSFDLSYLSID